MQTLLKHLVLALTTLTLMACGSGFQSSTSSPAAPAGNTNTGTGNNDQNNGDLQKTWTQVSDGTEAKTSSSTSTSGLFMPSGTFVVRIDTVRQALEFIIPIPASFNIPITSMAIPNLDGALIEQITQANGAPAMGIVIPLKHLLKDTSFGEYGTLPNGQIVPFLPFGKTHGFALDFPQNPHYRLHLYMAVNGAAVFIETPDWKIPSTINGFPVPSIGFPLYNKGKTQQVAYFSVVPNQGVYSSGIYIASRIPDQMAVLIDDLLRF